MNQNSRDSIVARIEKAKTIVDGLENSEAFRLFVKDFKDWADRLDSSWQYIQDDKVLKEAQITKMATVTVINALDNYKAELKKAQDELTLMDNPDLAIPADYDTESKYE